MWWEGYAAAALAGSAVLSLMLGWRARGARARIEQRLHTLGATSHGGAGARAARPSLRARTLRPLVAQVARVMNSVLPERQIERIRTNLAQAGLPYSRQLTHFLAAKALLAIAAVLLVGLLIGKTGAPLPRTLLIALVAGTLGFYLPGIWLARRIAHRRQQIVQALPDALDLLSISVGSGLGFDGATLEVVQRWQNPLADELAAVLRDLRVGNSRRDALRALAARTGVPEVGHFVAAIIQADELGTPIRDALYVQAEQMRLRRRHRAEELARTAAIKLLIPMALFIFPAMFVVLIGPALPSLLAFLE